MREFEHADTLRPAHFFRLLATVGRRFHDCRFWLGSGSKLGGTSACCSGSGRIMCAVIILLTSYQTRSDFKTGSPVSKRAVDLVVFL